MVATQNHRLIGILQILLGAGLFGLIPILLRFGKGIPASNLLFFRGFFGAIFLYFLIKSTKKTLAKFNEEKLKLVFFAVVFLLAAGSYFVALRLIDIASAVLLLYSQTIFIVILSRLWLKEKISGYTYISVILSIVGIILIVSPTDFKFNDNFIGYLLGISAAFWGALNFMMPKKYFKSYDTYSLTFYQSLIQIPIMFIFIILYPPTFTVANIGIFIIIGAVCTGLAFLLIYTGSRKVPGQYIGILQTTEAIVPIILGIIIFAEIPSITVIVGGILLLIGYVLIAIKELKTIH